jgi:protein ImuA
MPASLPHALRHPLLWQGSRRHGRYPTLVTGHERLDQVLPGGGWPLGALTELLVPRDGVGEFSLLLPTLARVSTQGGWVVLVDPPWTPYPPAMRGHGIDLQRLLVVDTKDADASLWACEQALRGVRGGVVLSWLRGERHRAGFTHLRRLQLAARDGRKGAFLFRPLDDASKASPAALRLHLEAEERALQVTVLKCRGQRPGVRVRLQNIHPVSASLSDATPDTVLNPNRSSVSKSLPGERSHRDTQPTVLGHA